MMNDIAFEGGVHFTKKGTCHHVFSLSSTSVGRYLELDRDLQSLALN
jgi:hypothetical protein